MVQDVFDLGNGIVLTFYPHKLHNTHTHTFICIHNQHTYAVNVYLTHTQSAKNEIVEWKRMRLHEYRKRMKDM